MISNAQRAREAPGATHQATQSTYFQYPAIKPLEWGWEVMLYLFLGGLAAGSYVVATLVDLFGTREDRPVARAGRYLALAATAVSPLLLIADLGRWKRFGNMMRILKTRSPMSMGTWGLAIFGLFVGLGAVRQAVEDGLVGRNSPPARLLAWVPLPVFGVLGTLFSFFVGSYTGVLLSFTNVPLWAKNHLFQGPLFLTSALSSGLAAISLALVGRSEVSPRTQAWLGQAESAATLGELGLIAGSLATLGPLSRPLLRRKYGLPFWLGAVGLGLVVPLVLRHNGDKSPKGLRSARSIAASLSVLLGGLIFRGVTVLAGRDSAMDPSAYFAFTKGGRQGNG